MRSGLSKDRLDLGNRPMVIGKLVDNPVNQLRQEFAFHRPTGFADGRQHGPSPVLRTALVERAHQQTVRCADEIHVAGLPLAAAHLTIAEPQLLLAVPMKRLGGLIARHKIQQGLLFFSRHPQRVSLQRAAHGGPQPFHLDTPRPFPPITGLLLGGLHNLNAPDFPLRGIESAQYWSRCGPI